MQNEIAIPAPNYRQTPLYYFFENFNYRLITISVRPEKNPNYKMPEKTWFSSTNKIRAIPFDTFFTSEVQDELRFFQDNGCGVFFHINEGNGKPLDVEKGILNCGRRENIIKLRTLAIDTDNANISHLAEKLKEIKLFPHYSVESSKGKAHIYFLLEPEDTTPENIRMWEALQRYLHSLVPGLDQSMTDTNQILRPPSFYNLKPEYDKPFEVRIVNKKPDLPKYNLKFLYDRLGAHEYDKVGYVNGHAERVSYNKFEWPKGFLEKGSRRPFLCRLIEHLMENVLDLEAPPEEYFLFIDGAIHKYLKPEDRHIYLEGGDMRSNLKQYLEQQRNWRRSNKQKEDMRVAEKEFQHIEEVKDKKLPDDFYLNFPGDLGMITREIHNYANFLSLEMCFVGALCISGMVKAESFRLKGSWPFVNGLVIAGPGGGKSRLKTVIEKTLTAGGFGGKYSRLIDFPNSAQSLHRSLYKAGGIGTVLVDESGDYLQNITSKNAHTSAKALKKYFKEGTTGTHEGTRLYPGGAVSNTLPVIEAGLFSLWLFIQPSMFSVSLNPDDMEDGFLPRFFIFNGKVNLEIDDDTENTETFKPSNDLLVMMQSITSLVGNVDIKGLIETTEKEVLEKNKRANQETLELARMTAIYEARYENRLMSTVEVELTPSAERVVKEHLKKRKAELNEIVRDKGESDASVAVYVRMKEMLHRLMCNAAELKNGKPIVSEEIAQACIDFQIFQNDRFFNNEFKEMAKAPAEKEEELIKKALKRAVAKNLNQAVLLKDITLCISHRKRPRNIRDIVQNLVKAGEIWEVRVERAKNRFTSYFKPAETLVPEEIKKIEPIGDC